MAAEALQELLRVNLTLATAALLVLALRHMMRRLFGARVAYGLWLILPAAILGLALPAQLPEALVTFSSVGRASALATAPDHSVRILVVWAAGAAAMLIVLAARQRAFVVSLGALTEDVLHRDAFRASGLGAGPAIVGAVRPRLVLPRDFEVTFDELERELVLAHERQHLSSGDAVMNGLVAVGQCLCWFNPLAHLAARCVRIDQELACDAAVVAQHPAEKGAYAAAMLKAQMLPLTLPIGCAWPARGEHPLKLRIALLKRNAPGRGRTRIGATVVMVVAFAGAGASWAALPPSTTAVPAALKEPVGTAAPAKPATLSPETVSSEILRPEALQPPKAPPLRAESPRPRAVPRDVTRVAGRTTDSATTSTTSGTSTGTAPTDTAPVVTPDEPARQIAPLPDTVMPNPAAAPSPPNIGNFRPRPQ